ncbi:hypothetical protein U1Q18_046194 [Sarracenia purpurea var. burkii]
MGKKKTKEVSVAIAESSSMGSEVQITPRKRGRPRKIVEKTESGEVREELAQEEEEKRESKKANKMSEEEEQRRTEEQSTASYPVTAKEGGGGEPAGRELPKGPTSSRARRKSKPRKSS